MSQFPGWIWRIPEEGEGIDNTRDDYVRGCVPPLRRTGS